MVTWHDTPDAIRLSDHNKRHENDGADEINVDGLTGLLADEQHVLATEIDYGLSFQGVITTYTDSTHFKVSTLAGKGTGFFKPFAGAAYGIYVVKADGAAPEGQMTPVVAYTSADGTFQHVAFSGGNLAVGDIVLIIHHLVASLDDIMANLAAIFHHFHSRYRVYPQDASATITLVADAASNTFGSWTEIIPIDTIDFSYMVSGLVIEALDAATTIFIQLGYSITDGDDPTTTQILGERRVLLPTPVSRATEVLGLMAASCPANAKLWGRMKTASVAADEAEISVVVTRHAEITNPISHLTTWPWSS